MAYKDLDSFFDPDLKLPVRGKWYTVPAPGGPETERLRSKVVAEGLPPVEQVGEALKMLGAVQDEDGHWSGGVYDEMVADEVPWPMIYHCGRTAILHYGFTPDMAESHWGLTQLGRMVDLEHVTETVGKFLSHVKSKQ